MLPTLPHEIYELICIHLLGSDMDLHAYSLSCHHFHSIAQKYLFEKITLMFSHVGMEHTNVDKICHLLLSSPQIAALVKEVAIVDDRRAVRMQPSYLCREAIFSTQGLPRLTNLETLRLESTGFPTLMWPSISSDMANALNNTCHRNIAHLALYRVMDVPLEILDGCTSLVELSLELVTFSRHEMDEFESGRWKSTRNHNIPKLKSLQVTLSDPLFHFFSKWITSSKCNLDASTQRRFSATMTMEYHDLGNVNRILQACTDTLEIFCFSPTLLDHPNKSATIDHIDIRSLPRLRVLRLRVGIVSRRRLQGYTLHSIFPWTFDLLRQLESSLTVCEISLKVSLAKELENGAIRGRGVIDMSAWGSLDSFLALNVTPLRSLRFICLDVEMESSIDARQQIRQHLPQLNDKGILRVEVASALLGFLCTDDKEFPRRVR